MPEEVKSSLIVSGLPLCSYTPKTSRVVSKMSQDLLVQQELHLSWLCLGLPHNVEETLLS